MPSCLKVLLRGLQLLQPFFELAVLLLQGFQLLLKLLDSLTLRAQLLDGVIDRPNHSWRLLFWPFGEQDVDRRGVADFDDGFNCFPPHARAVVVELFMQLCDHFGVSGLQSGEAANQDDAPLGRDVAFEQLRDSGARDRGCKGDRSIFVTRMRGLVKPTETKPSR